MSWVKDCTGLNQEKACGKKAHHTSREVKRMCSEMDWFECSDGGIYDLKWEPELESLMLFISLSPHIGDFSPVDNHSQSLSFKRHLCLWISLPPSIFSPSAFILISLPPCCIYLSFEEMTADPQPLQHGQFTQQSHFHWLTTPALGDSVDS